MSDPSTRATGEHRLPGRDDAASLHELCQDGSEVVIDVKSTPRGGQTNDHGGAGARGDLGVVVVPQDARDLVDGLSPYGT